MSRQRLRLIHPGRLPKDLVRTAGGDRQSSPPPPNSTALQLNEIVDGVSTASNDNWYKIGLTKGQLINVMVFNRPKANELCRYIQANVYGPDGITQLATTGEPYEMDYLSGDYISATATFMVPASGAYHVKVYPTLDSDPSGIYQVGVFDEGTCAVTLNAWRFDSPTLRHLWKAHGDDHAAAEHFYKNRIGHGPLIEPSIYSGQLYVTFLYFGDINGVTVSGGPVQQDELPLTRYGSTNLWYVTQLSPPDGNYEYWFNVDKARLFEMSSTLYLSDDLLNTTTTDPLNPVFGPDGDNLLTLPDAPPQPLCDPQPGVPEGKVITGFITSEILGEVRNYHLYLPSGYESSGDYPLLVMFDGEWVGERGQGIPMPTILDNMIYEDQIVPIVMLGVDSQIDRDRLLPLNPEFVDFVTTELMPKICAEYTGISKDAAKTGVGGYSFGGLCASYCALQCPHIFNLVLSMSGSYWVSGPGLFRDYAPISPVTYEYLQDGYIQQQFLDGNGAPGLRFFQSVGIFEPLEMSLPNRALRDILTLKGYQVTYKEYDCNHNTVGWRYAAPAGLLDLYPSPTPAANTVEDRVPAFA